MHPINTDNLSKKSKLKVFFSIEPVDHSRPEEIKAIEVYFLGNLILSLREAFYKARGQFSTDEPGSIILLRDHAYCVIKEQVTLEALFDCCITIDIDGLSHYLTITDYTWTSLVFKDTEKPSKPLEGNGDVYLNKQPQ